MDRMTEEAKGGDRKERKEGFLQQDFAQVVALVLYRAETWKNCESGSTQGQQRGQKWGEKLWVNLGELEIERKSENVDA